MRKTFKYRLFPTPAQRTALQGSLDACRFVYNKGLEVRKHAWEERQEGVSRYDTIKMLPHWKKSHSFLSNAYSQCLQDSLTRLDLAFRAFFRRVKQGEKPGYPRFRGYYRYDSFTYPQTGFKLLDNGQLRLSKIGDVKIKLHRPLEGECKTLTILRDKVGNWYAAFSCIVESYPFPPVDKVVGIDLGLTKFAVLSNGKVIKRQRWAKRDKGDIARIQRRVAKYSKGSKERRKAIKALQHAYQRQANRRANFAHQISRQIVNDYQFIALEELNIRNMQENGHKVINRGIHDVAWAKFVQCTQYKAVDAGRVCVLVNPKNTTQACSRCGEIVPKDLSIRKHNCPHCDLSLDRDHNAALNILSRGLATLPNKARSSPLKRGE